MERRVVGGSRRGSQKSWATKVKTGCLTCKKRRIKCDEGKPSCKRCVVHNVECEGYHDFAHQEATAHGPNATASGWEILTPNSMSTASASTKSTGSNESRSSSSISAPTTDSDSPASYSGQNDNNQSMIVARYYKPQSIDAWTETFSPYRTSEQLSSLRTWMALAPSMSRSQQGLKYWAVSVPTIAWSHATVRHAMSAVSVVARALQRKDDPTKFAVMETRALGYANQCIRELLSTKTPPEAVIACSSLFWVFEMLIGNWSNSMKHLAAGTKIAKHTKLSDLSDPLVAQYIRSFVGDLPGPINPEVISKMSEDEQKSQSNIRHRYSLLIMRDALKRLDMLNARLNCCHSPRKDRAIQMVGRTGRELQLVTEVWPVVPPAEDEPVIIQQAISDHSPFISVIQGAERFLQDNKLEHLEEFETKFRPCIDQFIWLSASLQLAHRQQVIEVWNTPRPMPPRTNRPLPTTEIDDT